MPTMFRIFGGVYFRHMTMNVRLTFMHEVTLANLNDLFMQDTNVQRLKCDILDM
jgi:hypothetical protein